MIGLSVGLQVLQMVVLNNDVVYCSDSAQVNKSYVIPVKVCVFVFDLKSF